MRSLCANWWSKGLLCADAATAAVSLMYRTLKKQDGTLVFLANDGKTILPMEIEVLSIDEINRTGKWSQFLGDFPSYIKTSRIISVNKEFKVFNAFFLDGLRFRPLLDLPCSTLNNLALRHVLHDRFNAPTYTSSERIQFIEINDPIASMIDVEADTLGVSLRVCGFSFRDEPITYQEFLIPPNSREIGIGLNRNRNRNFD